jgi:hypothetical protein
MFNKGHRLPRLMTVRAELSVTFLVVATVGYIIWQSGFDNVIVKDWVQIGFWVIASLLACLTYLNARRGVLQPLRTEVFKAQLEALKNVQSLFIAKSELELRDAVALGEMVKQNAQNLLSDFAKVHFGQVYPRPGMTTGDAWKPLNPDSGKIIQDSKWFDCNLSLTEDRSAFWKTYKIPGLQIPNAHSIGCDVIRQTLEHPLLPTPVQKSLEAYMSALAINVDTLVDVLNRCAAELPQRYATVDSIDQIVDGVDGRSWISNSYYRELSLENGKKYMRQFADDVLRSIRDYLQADDLLNS